MGALEFEFELLAARDIRIDAQDGFRPTLGIIDEAPRTIHHQTLTVGTRQPEFTMPFAMSQSEGICGGNRYRCCGLNLPLGGQPHIGFLSSMAREEKKRVDTNAAASPRPGINSAFTGLAVPNLPPGPTPSPIASDAPQKVWKMGRVVLRRELARRGGKTVIVVHEFATHLPVSVVETIAKRIRTTCGCGGTVKGRTIEIQGDQPARVRAVLESEGFEVAGVR